MKKCHFCKKRIWFWQKEYLGLTPAHAVCDMIAFIKSTQNLVDLGFFTEDMAKLQNEMRSIKAHG